MFKVGDKVRVTEYSNKSYIGLKGVITAISDNTYPIRVYLRNKGFHSFNPQQLTPDNKNNEYEELQKTKRYRSNSGRQLFDVLEDDLLTCEELQNTTRYKTKSGKQLFDVLEDDLLTYEELRGFYKANIYKYTHRYKQKNGIEDLKKVKVYVDQLIKLEEKQDEI
jgi:hypothetical protein